MDGAITTTSTGSAPPPGTSNNGSASSSTAGGGGFLNLGNLGSSPAVVAGMGLFSTGGVPGEGGLVSSNFGTSLVGNGFANDESSGVGGVTGGNPSFDLNDFPSLGGNAGAAGPVTGSAAGSDNGLAAALRQQQQLLQQQMMQQGGNVGINVGGVGIGGVGVNNAVVAANTGAVTANNADKSTSNLYRLAMSSGISNGGVGGGPVAPGTNFNMTTEDFPALGAKAGAGGQHPPEGTTLGGTVSTTSGGGNILDPSSGGGSNQLDYTGLIGSTGAATSSGGGIQQGGSSSQTRPTSTISTQGGSSSSTANAATGGNTSSGNAGSGSSGGGGAIGGDYGLLGLLSVIRMTDADRNRLALGSDLTVLGLNLNSPDVLYSTFGGPFSDKPATKEPHYQVSGEGRDYVLFYFCGIFGYYVMLMFYPVKILGAIYHSSAANVLLHATSSTENGSPVKIPTGNTLLHLLRPAQRRIAGLFCTGAIHEGMEVPRGIQVMVQASDDVGNGRE